MIETLLSAGADLDAGYENERDAPCVLAARLNDNPAVFRDPAHGLGPDGAKHCLVDSPASGGLEQRESGGGLKTLRAAWAEQIESRRVGLDCNDWNEKTDFFQDARVEDVIACLNAGADPNSRGDWDKASLHHAAWWNEDSAVIEVLLAAGADVNAKSEEGAFGTKHRSEITPLHWAGGNLNPEVTKLLLAAGADVHARGQLGDRPPLHWAGGARLL